MSNESHKKCIKVQYDKSVKPHVFSKGDIILLYNQESDKLRSRKFEPMWLGSYIFKRVLTKGGYEIVYFYRVPLAQPRNGLSLKKYYASFFA